MMNTVIAEFCHRVEGIPFYGLGLSTDAYQPEYHEVMAALDRQACPPDFTECFRAATPMLAELRGRYPEMPMPYHGEGLWLTQPGWAGTDRIPTDLALAVEQVGTLRSAWLNHECASKVVAGVPLGTYLPPVWTTSVAGVVAQQARQIQRVLDRESVHWGGPGPLLLLELPPLTYFEIGDLQVAEFFRTIADQVACGLVLDIGHLWTHYRYGRARRGESIEVFVDRFLDRFPVDRVVEVHVAGLAAHPAVPCADQDGEPLWIDTHGARVPPVLFDMLDHLLQHWSLPALRGVALEVDTKPVELIAEEFATFRRRYEWIRSRWGGASVAAAAPVDGTVREEAESIPVASPSGGAAQADAVERCYLDLLLGRNIPERWIDIGRVDPRYLDLYRRQYLPYELLHWGGDLRDMFPDTCARLAAAHVPLEAFVPWWLMQQDVPGSPFDFFTLKIDRFVEFVRQRVPEAWALACQEAEGLRAAYAFANLPAEAPMELPS